MEKEHFKTKIYTSVLNPEQRTKVDKLQSQWHERTNHIGRGMQWRDENETYYAFWGARLTVAGLIGVFSEQSLVCGQPSVEVE
jgi:hypothetical protein